MHDIDLLSNWAKECDINLNLVLDIGAHHGEFIKCLDSKVIKEFHCFEPDIENFINCKNNLKNYEFVILHNFGIFYGSESCKVLGIGDNSKAGYMVADIDHCHIEKFPNLHFYEGKIFKLKKLEDVLTTIPDLAKIDVEASEYNILKNSNLLKKCKNLFIEWHNHDQGYVLNFIRENLPNHEIRYHVGSHTYLILK